MRTIINHFWTITVYKKYVWKEMSHWTVPWDINISSYGCTAIESSDTWTHENGYFRGTQSHRAARRLNTYAPGRKSIMVSSDNKVTISYKHRHIDTHTNKHMYIYIYDSQATRLSLSSCSNPQIWVCFPCFFLSNKHLCLMLLVVPWLCDFTKMTLC